MAERFQFTKKAIEALPLPASGRVRYFDLEVRGLALYVHSGGAKVFYLYRKKNGRPVEVKLGAYDDLTIAQARDEAGSAWEAARKGEDPARVLNRGRRGEWTFGQLCDWWLEHAELKKKSWRDDKSIIENSLGKLKTRRLSTISRADFRALHAELERTRGRENKKGEKTGVYVANKMIRLARAMFNRAIAHDLFDGQNPAVGVELGRERSRDRRLTAGEIAAFFDALEASRNVDLRDYVLLSLYTGARRANVLAMRWDQIDMQAAQWRIPETKNGLPQVVPLLDQELVILKRRRSEREEAVQDLPKKERDEALAGWVFPSHGKTGHITEPKKGWRSLLDQAEIDDLRLHDLRRTLGSWMADTGTPLNVIGKTLGHQSQAATNVYARLSLDPIREAKGRAIEAIQQARKRET